VALKRHVAGPTLHRPFVGSILSANL